MKRLAVIVGFLVTAFLAGGGFAYGINYGWILLMSNGVSQGPVQKLDCRNGITCTRNGVEGRITGTAGAADGGWLTIDAGPAGALVWSSATEWKTNSAGSQYALAASGGSGAPTWTTVGNPGELLVGKSGANPGWVGAGDAGTLLIGQGRADPVWIGPGMYDQFLLSQALSDGAAPSLKWFTARKLAECAQANRTAGTLTCYGGTNNAASGTAQASLTNATRWYVAFTTTTTTNNTNGWCATSTTNIDVRQKPTTYWAIRTHDTDISNQRMWFVHSSANISLTTVPTASTAASLSYWGFGYQASINSGRFGCCMGDSSNHSCTDTGVTVATATEYDLVTYFNGTTLYCSVNGGAWVTNTSNPPTTLGPNELDTACVTNLNPDGGRTLYLSHFNWMKN